MNFSQAMYVGQENRPTENLYWDKSAQLWVMLGFPFFL